jgi:hypothetical protein
MKAESWKLALAESATRSEENAPLFKIAGVLMRLDHIARFIVNANHSIMGTHEKRSNHGG